MRVVSRCKRYPPAPHSQMLSPATIATTNSKRIKCVTNSRVAPLDVNLCTCQEFLKFSLHFIFLHKLLGTLCTPSKWCTARYFYTHLLYPSTLTGVPAIPRARHFYGQDPGVCLVFVGVSNPFEGIDALSLCAFYSHFAPFPRARYSTINTDKGNTR